MTQLKICGLTDPEDMAMCVELGVDAVGINFWAKSRRGVNLDEARRVLDGGHGPAKVGVFVHHSPEAIRDAFETLQLDFVQVHDERSPHEVASWGLPWVWVIRGTPDLATLSIPNPAPAWVLLDAMVAGFGGQGVTTDWAWARRAATHISGSVWLAGGVRPENAASAIDAVVPDGLDVASGAEGPDPRRKDRGRVVALLDACRAVRDPSIAPEKFGSNR